MSFTLPAKEVDVVNAIKSDLVTNVEKISKIDSSSSSYKELFKRIYHLLTKLGKLDVNVGTLQQTKIGRLMTKYEKGLPDELSDVAKENNRKWHDLLVEYRESFKKKKFIKINEVAVKEEPPSQESFDELLESRNNPDFSDYSQNLLLANSLDFEAEEDIGLQTGTDIFTSTPMENDSDDNRSNQEAAESSNRNEPLDSTSQTFFSDMRDVVNSVTNSISSVETECSKMMTMIEYINDKLNNYEKNLHANKCAGDICSSKTNNATANSTSNSRNTGIRKQFEQTGRVVMPKLFSPPPKEKSNTNTNVTDSTQKSVSTMKPSCTNTSKQRVSRIPSDPEKSETMSSTKASCTGQSSTKTKTQRKNSEVKSPKDIMSDKTVSSSSVKSKKVDQVKKVSSSLRDKTGSDISANTGVITDTADVSDEDMNPCTSSNFTDNDETLVYPIDSIPIKLEDPDDIEFYCHNNDNPTETVDETNNISPNSLRNSEMQGAVSSHSVLEKHNNGSENSGGHISGNNSQKLKRRSLDKNEVPESVKSKNKDTIHDQISNISHKLKRKSVEEKEPQGESSKTKSSVFEMDSDGFVIPKMVNQNELQTDEETILLKGVQVDGEDVGVNLDDVELEDYLTYSQVVTDMSDEIDDIEKDYLLANKKNRTSWNNSCKNREGVRFSPMLVKTKGRMKAAHKASLGKQVVYNMLNKNKNHK